MDSLSATSCMASLTFYQLMNFHPTKLLLGVGRVCSVLKVYGLTTLDSTVFHVACQTALCV